MSVHKETSAAEMPGDGLLSLSLEFASIDHAPPPTQKHKPQGTAVRAEVSVESSNEPPPMPAVDLSKMPERAAPVNLVVMVHERNGWPCHTLFDRASWALHLPHLETHNRKAGMRVIIAKAETHGPKTTPYTIYVMHIKTAFSVRGISRRFSEFKDLDDALRAVKRTAPVLPRKKTWGKMSPKFITERKRQLQLYIEAILSDPACADSEPFRNFLSTQGHPIEQQILRRYSSGMNGAASAHGNAVLTPWRLATGTRLEAIESLVFQCRAARDVRQEARALNQMGIMLSQQGERVKALQAMRQAFLCCRQLDDADGLLSCALSWASIHAFFGEFDVAEQRLREAEGMAAELGVVSGQAWCHLLLALFKAAEGFMAAAAKEAVLASELFCNAEDYGHTALAHFTLGSLLLRCSEVRQAVEVLESSLLLRRRARDTLGLGESLSLLGQAFAEIGYQLHAMDYFDQALALCQEMGNRRGEAICLRHLGRVHHLHGDHHEALAALEKSLILCVRHDDAEAQAQCHENMADVHLDLGDVRQAIQHFEEALARFHRSAALAGSSTGERGLRPEDQTMSNDGANLASAVGEVTGGENGGGGEGGEESDMMRVEKKLQAAKALIQQANSAYDDYDRTLRHAQGVPTPQKPADTANTDDNVENDGVGGTRQPMLLEAMAGKEGDLLGMRTDVIQPRSASLATLKSAGPKFPLKFKMKVPGQEASKTFKFLQSWTVHRKYYQTSDDGAISELGEEHQ